MRPWFSLLVLLFSLSLRAEMPVSPLTFGPAPETQTNPQLAVNGDQYLAIWSDYRELPRLVTYATRLDAGGNVLDPQGIRLGELALPIVKSDGERWIVIDNMLTFIAIDRDGHIVERRRIIDESTPLVLAAFNGREFLLVWVGGDTGNAIRSALVDRDGRLVTQPATLPLPSAAALAFNGSRFLLIYPSSRGVWKSAVFDANGVLLSSDRTVSDLKLGEVSLATSDGDFVAVWRSFENARAIVAARFDDEGSLALGPVSVHSSILSTKIASDGHALTVYFVADDARLMAFSLSRDLVAGSDQEVVSRSPLAVRSFAVDGALAVADVYRESIESELYASRPGHASWRISGAAPSQREPDVAAGARSLLIVREENRGAGPDRPRTQIEATYVDRVTGASTELVVAPSAFAQIHPSVAVVDDVYFVTWREDFKILGRVIRDGSPEGDPVILQTEADGSAVVVSDGRDFLVLWWDWEKYTERWLKMARVSIAGEVVARAQPTRARSDLGTPSQTLACTREECLVVWREFEMSQNCPWYACTIDSRVEAIRIDASLQPIDAEPLVVSDNDSTINHITVAAAGDGSYAVAWSGNANRTIHVRTVDRFGLGPLLLRSGHRPNLVRQGDWWLLVHDSAEQLAAARFRSGAAAFDVPLHHEDAQSRGNAALARIGADVAVVYERTTRNEPAGGVPRIYIDTIPAPKAKTRAISFR